MTFTKFTDRQSSGLDPGEECTILTLIMSSSSTGSDTVLMVHPFAQENNHYSHVIYKASTAPICGCGYGCGS